MTINLLFSSLDYWADWNDCFSIKEGRNLHFATITLTPTLTEDIFNISDLGLSKQEALNLEFALLMTTKLFNYGLLCSLHSK